MIGMCLLCVAWDPLVQYAVVPTGDGEGSSCIGGHGMPYVELLTPALKASESWQSLPCIPALLNTQASPPVVFLPFFFFLFLIQNASCLCMSSLHRAHGSLCCKLQF